MLKSMKIRSHDLIVLHRTVLPAFNRHGECRLKTGTTKNRVARNHESIYRRTPFSPNSPSFIGEKNGTSAANSCRSVSA